MAVIPTNPLERTLLRWGRIVAALVLVLAALDWVGWATEVQTLTRIYPSWPPMTPWTALWLAALASAILVQSGDPSPGRVWVGRGLAATVAVIAAAVLAEYLTGRTFGLDQVWFGDAVRMLQPTLPGRPSPPTVASVLLLSAAVALKRTNRRGLRADWAVCLLAAMVVPFITIVAYLFGAIAQLEIASSTGMAVTTALGLLLLGVACMLLRPAWLLARSDRLSLTRLGMILTGFPVLVGLSRRAYLALGLRDDLALTFATATATVVLGTAAYRLSRREHALREASESDRTLLRANADRLVASEQKYRLLAENVADVVYLVQDGKIAWVSPSVEQVSGAPPEYWVGRELREAIPPEDWAESAKRNATVLAGGVVKARARAITADGVIHWVDVHAKPFYDTDGRQDGFVASLRVIDDEVAAQQELARYKQLIETSSVGTALSNLDGSMAVVNQAACDLAGFDMDTALQMTWMQAIPEPHLQALLGAIDDLLAGRIDSYRGEHVFIHADGQPRWIDMSLSVMRKPDGQPEYVIFQFVDITAEVQAREQLEAARLLLAASTDSMLDPQVLLEAVRDRAGQVIDFRYLTVNAATCVYLGLQESDLVGHTQLEASPNLEGSELHRRYIRCLEDGEPVIIDDYSFFNEIIDDHRRYDIRATRAGADLISLTWRDVTERFAAAQRAMAAQTLLHATVDSMLDPQALMEAVRDRAGQVIDFVYRSANLAFCSYRGGEEREIIGQSLLEAQPTLLSSGLLGRYVTCVDTGESVILDDFEMFNSMLGDDRRFDIRVVRAGVDLISLTFSDVTGRFDAARRIAESEQNYRLLAENSSDMVIHVRDGRFAWTSPSVADVVGASPKYWVGRQVREIIPPEDAAGFAERLATLEAGGTVQERIRVVAVDGVTHWIDLHARPLYDDDGHQDGFTASLRVVDDEVAARHAAREARRLQARADALYRRSVDSAAVGMCLINAEGGFVDVNEAVCEFFGYDAETLKSKAWQELTAEKYLQADLDKVADVLAGRIESYRMTKGYIHADGHPIWGDLSVSCLRDDKGKFEVFISQITDITAEVQAREQLEEARRQKQRDDARYRNSIDNAAVGMCMVTPEGVLQDVNEAMCQLFGYEAEAMNGTHWQDFTAPEFLDAEVKSMNGILEGRIDSYRMVKHYRHAHGHVIWGDLSVSGVRDDEGNPEHLVALITDVTAEVQARERLAASEKRNRVLAQGLQSELSSAAKYLQSVLPGDMAGQVSVSTRYLPSNTLGGDSFDFRWIDDDHMIVYLLDVSGHGVESALIAVSVHNMLRSASFAKETMLEPDRVLAALNQQFGMDQHDDNYFTIFYGVYQRSSDTLRYANAGHPPALLFTGGQATELSSQSMPAGMFADTPFTTATVPIPPGSQMLLYSDGVYELPCEGGGQWPLRAFLDMCTGLGGTPDWTLDDVIDNALDNSASGSFDDDCCLVRLTFD